MDQIKLIDEDRITSVIEEAEVNYKTGRYEDAAKNFEYLSREMLDNKLFEDMIYFAYRSMIARKQINDIPTIVKNMQTLGLNVLKISTYLASEHLNKTLIYEEKTELLWIAQKNLELLGDSKQRKQYVQSLTKIYFKFASDVEFSYAERRSYLERNLQMYKEIKQFKKYKSTKEMLALLLEEQADNTLKSHGFDVELVAARLLAEAASILLEINNVAKHDILIGKAKKLDPKLKPVKTPNSNFAIEVLN
ncbi:MAG: hypothetical protein GPJ54_07445 [Candidatus Heimdallarchaeota archaeon]|nr:hypothetical protein [Candidatus Heimdallarchaeota archaeon]